MAKLQGADKGSRLPLLTAPSTSSSGDSANSAEPPHTALEDHSGHGSTTGYGLSNAAAPAIVSSLEVLFASSAAEATAFKATLRASLASLSTVQLAQLQNMLRQQRLQRERAHSNGTGLAVPVEEEGVVPLIAPDGRLLLLPATPPGTGPCAARPAATTTSKLGMSQATGWQPCAAHHHPGTAPSRAPRSAEVRRRRANVHALLAPLPLRTAGGRALQHGLQHPTAATAVAAVGQTATLLQQPVLSQPAPPGDTLASMEEDEARRHMQQWVQQRQQSRGHDTARGAAGAAASLAAQLTKLTQLAKGPAPPEQQVMWPNKQQPQQKQPEACSAAPAAKRVRFGPGGSACAAAAAAAPAVGSNTGTDSGLRGCADATTINSSVRRVGARAQARKRMHKRCLGPWHPQRAPVA